MQHCLFLLYLHPQKVKGSVWDSRTVPAAVSSFMDLRIYATVILTVMGRLASLEQVRRPALCIQVNGFRELEPWWFDFSEDAFIFMQLHKLYVLLIVNVYVMVKDVCRKIELQQQVVASLGVSLAFGLWKSSKPFANLIAFLICIFFSANTRF